MESDEPLDGEPLSPDLIWTQLDARLRSRVVSLLVQTAYEIVVSRPKEFLKEVENDNAAKCERSD